MKKERGDGQGSEGGCVARAKAARQRQWDHTVQRLQDRYLGERLRE